EPDLRRHAARARQRRDASALTPPMSFQPSRPVPLDQADGLRRLFAHARVTFIPVVSNPHVAFGGVMLERLCTAFGEHGRHTLVVDAGEHAPAHAEMATMELPECIEGLSSQVSYLAARGLPIRFVDTHGSTAPFLHAVSDAAPTDARSPAVRRWARETLQPVQAADPAPVPAQAWGPHAGHALN